VTKRLLDSILKTHNLAHEFMEDEREKLAKLIQLRNVLERDRFEGLNRKVRILKMKRISSITLFRFN
jgi:hypothetical protein